MLIQATDEAALREIIATNPLVVVDFYSTDCPPCSALAPIYEAISQKYPSIPFAKIMRQDNRELAQSFYVMGSPTVLFFRDGQLLPDRLAGPILEKELEAALKKSFPEIVA